MVDAAEALDRLLDHLGCTPSRLVVADESERSEAERLNKREKDCFDELTLILEELIDGRKCYIPDPQKRFLLHRRVVFACDMCLVLDGLPCDMSRNQVLRWLLHEAYRYAMKIGFVRPACLIPPKECQAKGI